MAFKTGYLYFINPCNASVPPKPKLAVCISATHSLFYLINSCDGVRPYQHEKGHIVILEEHVLSALVHNSYINVTKPRIIESGEYSHSTEREKIPNNILLKIKKQALCDRKLQNVYKNIIKNPD